MNKVLIITVGTSLIENIFDETKNQDDIRNKIQKNSDNLLGKLLNEKENHENDIKKINEICDEFITEQIDYMEEYSAEINIIKNVDYNISKVYLLYSETIGGEISVNKLQEVINKRYKNIEIKKSMIEGWQVNDKDYFKQDGIINLYNELDNIKIANEGNEFLVSPLGGYKSIIPYVSVYSMVNKRNIYYIFEESDEMLSIPNGMLNYLLINQKYNNELGDDFMNQVIKSNEYDGNQILKLLFATERFEKAGDLGGFNELDGLESHKEIIDELQKLDKSFKLGRIRSEEIRNLLENIGKIESKDILFPIFKRIKEQLEGLNIEGNDLDFYFSVLKFYYKKKLYLQGFLFMREFIIDCSCYHLFDGNLCISKEDNIKVNFCESDQIKTNLLREYIFMNVIKGHFSKNKKTEFYCKNKKTGEKFTLNIKFSLNDELFKGLKEFVNKIGDIRNYFAHYKDGKDIEELEKKFKEYYKLLKDFYNHLKQEN